jgi:alpha-beta hydrolase superfamily lysophospholipase
MTVSPKLRYFCIELTDEASWFDHSRDLLHLVNVKRSEMPQPIIGIGHSLGGIPM